jgi:hypothetical protein
LNGPAFTVYPHAIEIVAVDRFLQLRKGDVLAPELVRKDCRQVSMSIDRRIELADPGRIVRPREQPTQYMRAT